MYEKYDKSYKGGKMIHHGTRIWGVTCVGERGQFVIPAKLREELGIKKGDELVVISKEKSKAILLVREETLTTFLKGTIEKIEGLKVRSANGKGKNAKK